MRRFGHGWAAHPELSSHRVDGAVGLDEEIQHSATRGMANCPKDILMHHHLSLTSASVNGLTTGGGVFASGEGAPDGTRAKRRPSAKCP